MEYNKGDIAKAKIIKINDNGVFLNCIKEKENEVSCRII